MTSGNRLWAGAETAGSSDPHPAMSPRSVRSSATAYYSGRFCSYAGGLLLCSAPKG